MVNRKRESDRVAAAAACVVEELEQRRLLSGTFGNVVAFGTEDELDSGFAIQSAPDGGNFVTGRFHGTVNFNPGSSHKVILRSNGDHDDIFLARYSAKGKVVWAKRFGGGDDDWGKLVELAPNGDLIISGMFQDVATFGKFKVSSHGQQDAYIARVNPSNGAVRWAGAIGGDRDDFITAVAGGPDGDVYISGTVRITGDIDPNPKTSKIINTIGVDDTFMERLDGSNGHLKWDKVWGENDTREGIVGMAIDANGGIIAAGTFNNTVRFDRQDAHFNREAIDDDDIFLARMTTDGNWDWIKDIGGSDEDMVADMVMGPNGDLYMTGNISGTANFATSGKAVNLDPIGDSDAWVARYHADGSLVWARDIGGDGAIIARSVSVDAKGRVYTSGEFLEEIDFDPSKRQHIVDPDKSGDAPQIEGEPDVTDGYVLCLDAKGRFVYVRNWGGPDGSVAALALAATPAGDVYVTGSYGNEVDFNPLSGKAFRHTADDNDDTDIYILKLNH